ncbi:MAG: SCP2 sterol-binding domain-containing protein [Promethearchaeota archaeon]
MEKKEFQAKILLYIVLKSVEEVSKVDEDLQEELEDYDDTKIQWKIGNFTGYLHIKDKKVIGVIDEEIDNPDVTIIIPNPEKALEILTGKIDGVSAYMSGDLVIEGSLPVAMAFNDISDIIMDYLEPIIPE